MKVHELKCWPDQFWAIEAGRKRVEVRVNDRDFDLEDLLVLTCYVPSQREFNAYASVLGEYRTYEEWMESEVREDPIYAETGRAFAEEVMVQVTHITRGRFLAEGYVALSVRLVEVTPVSRG